MATDTDVHEPEVVDDGPNAIALRHPGVPTTINELAARKGEALEIIDAREQVLKTLRQAAIRATSPEDWLLFRSPDGRVTGYLQDAGCDRIRDLYSIEIYDVSRPEKVTGSEPGVFHYLITACGRCKITGQVIENIEGGRSSTDDFCKGKTGVELELAVRKAARANLDGGIVRELAAMQSVPLEELATAWSGTNKKTENCRLGRGFGSKVERHGGTVREQEEPAGEVPFCEVCGARGKFFPAGKTKEGKPYDAFWGCPKKDTHKDQKWAVSEEKWRKDVAAEQKTKAAAAPTEREPGVEG